jgi:hypothetical protein
MLSVLLILITVHTLLFVKKRNANFIIFLRKFDEIEHNETLLKSNETKLMHQITCPYVLT